MSFFQFSDPAFFFLLLLLPILAWWAGRMGPEAAVRFSSTTLVKAISRNRHSRPGKFLFGLRLLALAAVITALARPQIGKMNDDTEAEGIDIVVTLDLSGSMRALDLSTRDDIVTRLDAAKRVVNNFIAKREFDRIGLVAFAANAYVVSPLTLNHDWLKRNLKRLELGEIDGGGTAIGTALGASVNRLRDHEARSVSLSYSLTARITRAQFHLSRPPKLRRLLASKSIPSPQVKRVSRSSQRQIATDACVEIVMVNQSHREEALMATPLRRPTTMKPNSPKSPSSQVAVFQRY